MVRGLNFNSIWKKLLLRSLGKSSWIVEGMVGNIVGFVGVCMLGVCGGLVFLFVGCVGVVFVMCCW